MKEQYLREIVSQFVKLNKNFEKLINSLEESRKKLSEENEKKITTQIGSSGDFGDEKKHSLK